MKSNQKGFSIIEILLVTVVVGLIGTVGWLVYDRQSSKSDNTKTVTEEKQIEDAVKEDISQHQTQNEESNSKKSFTAYGTTLSIDDLQGWEYMGIYGYLGESSDEYQIHISNKAKDIQLFLQISTYESGLYEQSIFDSFTGFNGETYYLTVPLDDKPGDTKYQQMGISACDNGHCVTKINDKYNLNANITPIGSNTEFSGTAENISEIKKLFSSIAIE